MSNQSSLLDFLKRKSLFSNSPVKRSRSKSRQSSILHARKDNYLLVKNGYSEENRHSPQHNDRSFKEARDYQDNFNRKYQYSSNQMSGSKFRYQQIPSSKNKSLFSQRNASQASGVWAGSNNGNSNFESARIESAQCLQNISKKLNSEISSINNKIEIFNTQMYRTLNSQLKNIAEKLYQIIDASVKQIQKHIRDYIRNQEALLLADINRSKILLEKEAIRVEAMQNELTKFNWRKVAGEILSSQMEKRVQEEIKDSRRLHVGYWQMEDFASNRIKRIQLQIKQIFRLKM